MIRFASLGSGSKGNATLIEVGKTRILLDCGFSVKETEKRLLRLGCEPSSLDALVVTHVEGGEEKELVLKPKFGKGGLEHTLRVIENMSDQQQMLFDRLFTKGDRE